MSAINPILSIEQINALRKKLVGRMLQICFGSGVDSTALIVALHEAGIRPDVITFANTLSEKALTYRHLEAMQEVMIQWGWPPIDVVVKKTLDSTPYDSLFGNCMSNETLPSLAFGLKSCSLKWKASPQDDFIMGKKSGVNACEPHPVWIKAQETGTRILKLIGYDCGKADKRRSSKVKDSDDNFDYCYPLQIIGWARPECVHAITTALGADMVPVKSACFMCPASRKWEIFWLAANDPDQLEAALMLERNAMVGKHSRFDKLEFGDDWENLVRNAESFPSSNTSVGLGRSFAWNQYCLVQGIVHPDFTVKRDLESRRYFAAMAESMVAQDNALDSRFKQAGKSSAETSDFVNMFNLNNKDGSRYE